MKGCIHNWQMFRDSELVNTGYMSFFCRNCLEFAKRKIEYHELSKK